MPALFTDETVKIAMEHCQWYPRNQFVLTADLKPNVLKNAIANIAPELRKIELARKLEASGESEELPFIYEQIGFTSPPPEGSYYYTKCYLRMPLSRFSLSFAYYHLHCMKHNVRFCDDKIRRYDNPEYRAFIEMCNTTPLAEVREKLEKELNLCASWLKDANILNL